MPAHLPMPWMRSTAEITAAAHAAHLRKRLERGLSSLAPEPDGVGGPLAARMRAAFTGCSARRAVGELHHLLSSGAFCPSGRRPRTLRAGDVVRRREARARLSAAQHEALAVGDAGYRRTASEPKRALTASTSSRASDEGDLARAVIDHVRLLERGRVRQRDQVAAVGHVRRVQLDADARRLQRRAAGVIDARVVAEHGEVRRVAAGAHALGHGAHHAERAVLRHAVHAGWRARLQRRFPAQLRHRHVRHAVAPGI